MKEIQVDVTVGTPYGHCPGHQYRDVTVEIMRSDKSWWTVRIVESWGCNQGYDEEHGNKEVVGEGSTLEEAVAEAKDYALQAEIGMMYGSQALSQASRKARIAQDAAEA